MDEDKRNSRHWRPSRRTFLKLSAATGAMGLLAACAPAAPAPTATKPAAAPAAPAPTTAAPAAQPTAAPAKGAARKDLIYGAFGDPNSLNPQLRWDIPGGIFLLNIYETLTQANYKTRQMEPLLAESWKMIDPLTWQIKLREGVQWHKGYGEMTAEDLAYTWNYHAEKTTYLTKGVLPLDRVKVLSKYVAEVKLIQPFGAFPGTCMGYAGMMISKKAHEEMGDEKFSRNPIGTGPFVLDSWVSGSQVVLKKNPNYWRKGLPYLEEVVGRIIPDSHVRMQSLEKGEVDFITHPDAKDVAQARKNAKLVYLSTTGWNWDYQAFSFPPHQKPDFPNQDKRVRQAISLAVDRQAIVKEIYDGEATPTDSPIPDGFLGYRPGPLRYAYNGDLKKAKELIAQAGVKGFEVEVITSDKDWLRRELELVAAMVSQIGITYKIRNLDMGSFNNLFLNHKYPQLLEDITVVSPDADSTVWWFFHTKGTVPAGYSVPEMDKMLDEARSESDAKKREPIYHKVVDRALEDSPKIFHVHVNYVRMHKQGLEGFAPSPQEYVELFDSVRWQG